MRIVGFGGPALGPASAARRAAGERREPEAPEAETRALIAVEAPAPSERQLPTSRYPALPFLAHLIATRMQAPQTRTRRRATPEEAIAAYSAGRFKLQAVAGRRLRRTA